MIDVNSFFTNTNTPLENLYYLSTLFFLLFAFNQLKSCIKSNNINLFEKLYIENKEIRENQSDARIQLRLIMRELEKASDIFKTELETYLVKPETVALNDKDANWKIIKKSREESIAEFIGLIINIPNKILNIYRCYLRILKYRLATFPSYLDKGLDPITTREKMICGDIFTEIYFSHKYKDLRKTGYHYEYLGILIKYKMIPFNLVFDLITWPDDFWNESYYLRSVVRNHWIPDFWVNAEYLHDLYMDARLKGLISSGKFDTENLIYSKKTCLKHSNLSAYEHMSQRAYKDVTDLSEIADTVNEIGDDSYEKFKDLWKKNCCK